MRGLPDLQRVPEQRAAAAQRLSPLIRGSLWLHGGTALALLLRPRLWPWGIGALIADHLVLTAAGLWPRSTLLGPNWTHLPQQPGMRAVAVTIDDGPDPEVTPRVLDLLDTRAARATFFCVGERVRRHPQLCRDIVRRGHAVENHTERHLHRFSLLGPAGIAAEIHRAQEAIGTATGEVPKFFRAPAGLRSPFLQPILARMQLQLASWTRRGFDTVTRDPEVVLRRLTSLMDSGDIVLLHDGHAARTAMGSPVILEVLPRLLDAITQAGLETITLRAALARAP
jgi:peptidoglycan/xylan/chitin deacetylase (PgdA/CDA1 family)